MGKTHEVLGVDIWRVLIEPVPGRSFRDADYLDYPEVDDAFRVLSRLHDERFGERIHLITRCGQKLRQRRLAWLDHHRFWERTGIPRVPPLYCWNPYNKANVCQDLCMTHFIDDDPRELIHLSDLIPNLILLNPTPEHVVTYASFIKDGATQVGTWREIEKLLLP